MAYRPARSGSDGNMRLLKAYGGGSSLPRQPYPQGFATGGVVKGNPALAEGMAATSAKAPAKAGKKAHGKGTNVNVIVVPGGKPGAPEAPPPMLAGPPVGPGPGGPPMVMPPGPDAGPMPPMRKSGGRVAKSVGGPAKPVKGFDAGAGGGKGRLEKIKKYGA